jgi:hypothetical protein
VDVFDACFPGPVGRHFFEKGNRTLCVLFGVLLS